MTEGFTRDYVDRAINGFGVRTIQSPSFVCPASCLFQHSKELDAIPISKIDDPIILYDDTPPYKAATGP